MPNKRANRNTAEYDALVAEIVRPSFEEGLGRILDRYCQEKEDLIEGFKEKGYNLRGIDEKFSGLDSRLAAGLRVNASEIKELYREENRKALSKMSKLVDKITDNAIEDYINNTHGLSELPENERRDLKSILLNVYSVIGKMPLIYGTNPFYNVICDIANEGEDGFKERLYEFFKDTGMNEELGDIMLNLMYNVSIHYRSPNV